MSKAWYPYGYVGNTVTNEHTRVTLEQLQTKQTFRLLHSQAQERALCLMDDCPEPLGIGTGWRVQSATEFKRRHYIVPGPTGLYFEGKYWKLRPGFAAYAVPGNSYHESVPPTNTAFAIDFVGVLTWNGKAWVNTPSANRAIAWLVLNSGKYGMKNFANVNSEPWHSQLIEVPNRRKDFVPSQHVIHQWDWTFRNPIPPVTNVGEEVMCYVMKRTSDGATVLVTHGGNGKCIMWLDGNAAAVYYALKVPVVEVTPAQFDAVWNLDIPK